MPEDNRQFGAYVPETLNMDVTAIFTTDVNSPEFKELIVKLYMGVTLMAQVVNTKITGIYEPNEFLTSSQYPARTTLPAGSAPRQSYWVWVDFGALPNAGAKSVNHNIPWLNGQTTVLHIYGAATNTTADTAIPLPYSSPAALNAQIQVDVSSTQVTVTTAINYSAYNQAYFVIEYLKN